MTQWNFCWTLCLVDSYEKKATVYLLALLLTTAHFRTDENMTNKDKTPNKINFLFRIPVYVFILLMIP